MFECTEAKEELIEVVEFLKNPSKFTRLGATIPKGVLLIGPPGIGKTLLARAVAGEAGVPFFYCSGSEFDEVFVGLGASRIRKIFQTARSKTPCIIFVDELDALGGKRNVSDANYNRQTLNQFLVELDGFKKDTNLIVIGATNLPEALDKALTRSGRFDNEIHIPLPSYNDRIEIFEHFMKKVKTHPSVSAELLANLTPGLSGADISNLVNQAAQHASIAEKSFVMVEDFDWAREKVAFGRERKSLIMSEHDKKITAYHEAGHAIAAFYTKDADKLHKASIIPRGTSLGATQTLPEREQLHQTYNELQAHIDVCLGGRAAEEIIFGINQVTTGCSSDLSKATDIARAMVTVFGMNHNVGYISSDTKNLSEATQAIIDNEVKIILQKSYDRVKNLLKTHSEQHIRLANELIKRETLVGEDLENVILGKHANI
ncbi:ATP-dependent zinc metalloprotease YME1L1-like [Pempheris klunzingeri]|uniref:ATP-dependent zinc metalloprotease YME1L1-like n=1 Tax=Pempheris klunzingeri TaxID=3127111 RepID=UPI0039809D76